MADAADPPPTPPPAPPTLFDCVIRDDFDGMVRLYATAARDSAVSYAAFRRWKNRHQSSCELWQNSWFPFDVYSGEMYGAGS